MRQRSLERAALDGVELEYEVRGAGEPVMLVHAGACGDWFKGLMEQPALAGRHRLVRYHRVGYAGSSHLPGPVSLADQAGHCRSLMRHLGIGRAHVVGHSSSANIALQLALDTPEAVGSLALLEPALLAVPTGPYGAQAMERYRAGDKAGAVDTWMRGVCGPDWRAVFEEALPGAVEQAVADADTFLGQELPAVRGWTFGQEDARMSPSRPSPCSAREPGRSAPSSTSATSCCWPGCRTSSRSCCPTRPTCCTCRTPAEWPRAWPRSSPATRSRWPRGSGPARPRPSPA